MLLPEDEGAISQGLTTLACAKGNAGRGAQDVLQGSGRGLFDNLVRDHRDSARRVHKRSHILRIRRFAALALAMDVDSAERRGLGLVHRERGRGFGLGQDRGRAQHPRRAGCEKQGLERLGANIGHGKEPVMVIKTGSQ